MDGQLRATLVTSLHILGIDTIGETLVVPVLKEVISVLIHQSLDDIIKNIPLSNY